MKSIEYYNNKMPDRSYFTVIGVNGEHISPCGKRTAILIVKCKCGTVKNIYFSNVRNTFSCGCLVIENINKRCRKYTHTIPEIYKSWQLMISRCYRKKDIMYRYYGGSGVKVCSEWRFSYQRFLDWSLINGWEKGLQIDKDIKGKGKLYSPDTCLWVTRKENGRHKRNTIMVKYKGKLISLSEVCELNNIDYMKVYSRMFITGKDIYQSIKDTINKKTKICQQK